MSKFFNYDLQRFVSAPTAKAILTKVNHVEMPQGTTIVSPGLSQQHLYFIKKGVVRCYYQFLEDQWTNWFSAEGNPVFSTESFLHDSPSPEYIETCTPVILYEISRKDYEQLLQEFPELYELAFHLLSNYLRIAERRIYRSHMLTAYQRYEEFIETHRHIANRIQMKHIASYLGITPTHLSRVRKEFARKNCSTLK